MIDVPPPAVVKTVDLLRPKPERRELHLGPHSRIYLDGELVDSIPAGAEIDGVEFRADGLIYRIWFVSVPEKP